MWYASEKEKKKDTTNTVAGPSKLGLGTGKQQNTTKKQKSSFNVPKQATDKQNVSTDNPKAENVRPEMEMLKSSTEKPKGDVIIPFAKNDNNDKKIESGLRSEHRSESPEIEKLDLSKLDKQNGEKPFFIEDDRKSKITVVSLKTNRTARTSVTVPSVVQPPVEKRRGVFGKVKDGFRESSIKRIIASGFVIATFLLLLFGVFLPFWNVYTTTIDHYTTGYYGGLWNYCLVNDAETTCYTYVEGDLEAWLRAVRFFELVSFMANLGLLALTVAYMFFLRNKSYSYIQWILVALSFGIALFVFLGLIIYGASYSNSSHISSAYGLTFCAFFCSLASGGMFLWDKIVQNQRNPAKAAVPAQTSVQTAPLSSVKSYRSFTPNSKLGAASNRSKMSTPRRF